MLKSIQSSQVELALKFIDKDYYNCPFLYTNLKHYGIENDNVKLFLFTDDNDTLVAIAYKYYNCLHVYSKEKIESIDAILQLINQEHPSKMFFPGYYDGVVEDHLFNKYKHDIALVMRPIAYYDFDLSKVKTATVSDLYKIAEFMCSEWGDAYDSVDSLYMQMKERMKDLFGRTKYIEENGIVVACVSSYAEVDNFSVCGGLLVSDSQRGKKLGSVMLKSIYEELDKEGKNPCGLIVADYSRVFHEKNGFEVVGKLIRYFK